MTIRRELIDELLKECGDPKEILAEGGLLKQVVLQKILSRENGASNYGTRIIAAEKR